MVGPGPKRENRLGAMLPDSFGRVATDLRVSLTDRCNLRCAYCMPPEGLDWLPSPDQLTDDEVVRLVRVAGGGPEGGVSRGGSRCCDAGWPGSSRARRSCARGRRSR